MSLQDLKDFLDDLSEPRIFWWRDDDTGNQAPKLLRLLELQQQTQVPLVVSVVPQWLNLDCARLLRAAQDIFVAQHGFEHRDHSAPHEKSIELGGCVEPEWIISRLEQGRQCLIGREFSNLLALMVPPWNRLSEQVMAALPALGFQSVSTFARDQRGLHHGLNHINCHVDPILWREGKRPMSEDELTKATIKHLEEGANRPTGLLTHHLEMSTSDYALLENYLSVLSRHSNVVCQSPKDLFGLMA